MVEYHKTSTKEDEQGIAAFAIRNAHLTIAGFIALLLLGTVCAVIIPKDLLPSGNSAAVQILSFYPGMPADNVEQEITYPYERYTGQAVGIKSQESRSLTGVSIVRNYFQSSVDLSTAISQTDSLVLSVLRKLPPGIEPPVILPFDPMASQPLAIAIISGRNKTETELQDLARYWVTNSIQSVSGAMAPTVMGGKLRQVNVLLDGKKLAKLNLSPVRVNEKIEAMNSFIPAGNIDLGDFNFQLHSNAMFKDLSEVNDFYLRSQNGVPIKIRDVGKVEDGSAIQTNIVTVNGQKQVYIPIYRQLGANSLKVVDDVKDALKILERSLKGFRINIVNDQTIFIRNAIEAISVEAVIGGGLAALMILIFLGSGRATIAVLLTLPISVIGAIALLKFLGHTLNVMTLGGLALSIGVLVDNAIVVIEVILTKQSEGLDPKQAALAGAKEVAMPVLASTISTLIVFVPVLFLDGIVKTLFSALSISVVAALGISYYAAMMMVPLYAYNFLGKVKISTTGLIGQFQSWFKKVNQVYGKSLRWTLARSGPILNFSLFMHALVGISLVFFVGTELFPRADSGSFTINLRCKTGQRVEKTAEVAVNFEKKLRDLIPNHDLRMVISNSGVFYGNSSAYTRNSGSQDAFINVELSENRFHTSQYYAKIIREKFGTEFPDVNFSIELGGLLSSALNSGLASPIDIQVTGSEKKVSNSIAETLMLKIKDVRGVADARIQQRLDAPVLDVNMDRKKVSDYGLTPDLVVKNLVSAVSNSASYRQMVWVNPKTGIDYMLGVQYPENSINSQKELLDIPIISPDQDRSINLGRLAVINLSKGPTEITHSNLTPTVDIYLDTQDRDMGSVASDIQTILNKFKFPAGYSAQIKGEIREMRAAVKLLGWGFLLAACLVYLILVAQFRSFLMPAIIMTNVPKGIVGVIIILVATKTSFSIQAAIGCIFVIGVSVSHSVLLLEFILERVKHFDLLEDGIVDASMARLRPITMTSLASILGLLPMAIGMGHGAEANIPLGRAVIGGQLLSTFLNFYLLPCLYHQIASKLQKKSKSQQLQAVA